MMTTTRSRICEQTIPDGRRRDQHRACASACNLVPTSSALAIKAVAAVLPKCSGKLNGTTLRVPTPSVSVVDSDVDDDGNGIIGYEEFLKMMTHKILNRDPKDEILKAFRLFYDDETGKISFRNLKCVAQELGERVTNAELHDDL